MLLWSEEERRAVKDGLCLDGLAKPAAVNVGSEIHN